MVYFANALAKFGKSESKVTKSKIIERTFFSSWEIGIHNRISHNSHSDIFITLGSHLVYHELVSQTKLFFFFFNSVIYIGHKVVAILDFP